MDPRTRAVAETSTLELLDADDSPMVDDDGNRAAVVLFGPGSKQYAKANSVKNNRMMERLRQKGKADISPEQQALETAEFLAACTSSMQHIDIDDLRGHALFVAVYGDKSIGFIAEQAQAHLGEWSNFIRPALNR